MSADFSPLDLDSIDEIIAVVADDEEPKRSTSPEAESGEVSNSPDECACVGCSEGNPCQTIEYKACICDACESEEDFGTCWHCDDAECDGECSK